MFPFIYLAVVWYRINAEKVRASVSVEQRAPTYGAALQVEKMHLELLQRGNVLLERITNSLITQK